MKARYYVEWDSVRIGYPIKRLAFVWAKFDSLHVGVRVRVRYRGKVIARWRDGKRVTR